MTGKDHFAGLDALRGIAAVSVMCLHMRQIFLPGSAQTSAALAVDLFFMLSGFVIACAYRAKLDRGLSWSRFMAYRVIRLYPMILMGTIIGFFLVMVKGALHGPLLPEERAINLLPSLLLIPPGIFYADASNPLNDPSAFPFNPPTWSLFFEMFAYACYATSLRKMRSTTVTVVLIVMTLLLLLAAMRATQFSALGISGIVGFAGGFPRAIVPFMIGAIIYTTGIYSKLPNLPFLVPALLVVALLNVPFDRQWYLDAAVVLVAFPLIIGLAAHSTLKGAGKKLGDWLGGISYPVYLLHFPIAIGYGYVIKTLETGMEGYPVAIVCAITSLVFSWLALVYYDQPVRRYLLRKLAYSRSLSA